MAWSTAFLASAAPSFEVVDLEEQVHAALEVEA